MDILSRTITKIYDVKEFNRVVVIDAETESYAGKKRETLCFPNAKWKSIKEEMSFRDNECWLPDNINEYVNYLETMPSEEYYRKFEYDIKKFTDEELVEEINRRAMDALFPSIGFKVEVIVKKGV